MGNGEKIMKNLLPENIYRDEGCVDKSVICTVENCQKVKLPYSYSCFIEKHNGARLENDSFDFYDNVHKRDSCESIAFIRAEKINEDIYDLLHQSTDDPDDPDIYKFYKYFDSKLIPFGDTGGGDLICFDYRNHEGDDPPVVLWCHDYYDENWNRISFVANNFEEFINMLHEYRE